MGPIKKVERDKAIIMRKNGEKMSNIAKTLNVASSTVWLWVKDIELTPEQMEKAGLISHHLHKWKCTPIKTICESCAKPFDWYEGPSDFARRKHFCSKSCYWNFSRTLKGHEHEYRHGMLKSAWSRAKTKQVPFTITLEDIPIIPIVCPILGIPLQKGIGKATDNSPSLDRIIPALGYVPGNIRVISKRANSIKTNATATELMLVAKDLEITLKNLNDLEPLSSSLQALQSLHHQIDDEEPSSETKAKEEDLSSHQK